MKKNIGSIDKVIRLSVVAIIVVLYFTHIIHAVAALVLLVLAGILLLTSIVGTCPLYLPFGISTHRK